jgi:hypothetical protein
MIIDTTPEKEIHITIILNKPDNLQQRNDFDNILDHIAEFESDYNRGTYEKST